MGVLGAIWGFLGIFTLLGCAIWRLTPQALNALQTPLGMKHWIFLAVFTLFMLITQGYEGFQKRFAPRTAARIRYLRDTPHRLHLVLAPAFCMGYFHAKRRVQITSISLSLAVIAMILMLHFVPTPWRSLIDAGVVLGLLYGIATYIFFVVKANFTPQFPYSPEVPDQKKLESQ